MVAVLHGLANLVPHQPGRGVADADLLHQLHRRDALFVVAHAVDRPEPTGQRGARLVKDRTRRHRAPIAALLALMHPPKRDIAARVAAATPAAKPLRPTLSAQLLGALRFLAKLGENSPTVSIRTPSPMRESPLDSRVSPSVRLCKLNNPHA